MNFSKDSILINPAEESEKIIECIRDSVFNVLKKRGAVVGVSGGVDSSVVLTLTAKALGRDKVVALMLPEKESSDENIPLVLKLLKIVGVEYIIENLTEVLNGFGCYERRDIAVKKIFPEFDSSYKMKIILPNNLLEKDVLNFFYLEIISPEGKSKKARLPLKEYLQIVASSNFKQRSRMSMLYYHAESRNYAVIGTPNKNEHDQGFFVKYGDSGSDLRPIKHLFKTQVYQLADYLKIPIEIKDRIPTSDTYSAEQTQEEFFFRVPFYLLDRIWFGWENNISSEIIAEQLDLTKDQVENVIEDIIRKKNTTEYLRRNPIDVASEESQLLNIH